jgi:ATP-binding cassette subfamily C (CFTR/MRP) protein 1
VLLNASDVLLIDDPLSAVDAHVSKALFENVLSRQGILGKLGITVVLAMNQLHFLPHTDHIVVMKGGRIQQQGDYATLMQQQDGELASLMSSYGFEQDKKAEDDDEEKDGAVAPLAAVVSDKPAAVAASNAEVAPTGPAVAPPVASTTVARPKPAAGSTTQAETRMEGSVGWKVYTTYIHASGGWIVFAAIVFLFCVHQTGRVYADFWLADWSDQNWNDPNHTLAYWMGIFAMFGGVVTIASLIRSMMFAAQGLRGAFNLHQSMLRSIFRSPSSFFDTTPIGRIVNRFSADVDKLDHIIIRTLEGWGGCIFFVLGTFVAICVVYPYFVFPLLAIIFIYYKVQQYYVSSSRELQRLDSISKSPIFSHFGESLTGASSIRAFASGERCCRQNEQHVDANHRNILAYQAALCWLGIRIELISTLLMTVSAIFAVSSRNSIDASLVGLSIVYSITITSFLNFAVRLGSVVEGLMSSVERIEEFSVLPSEAAAYLPDVDPPAAWPKRGGIKFDNIVLRYRPDLDVVLRGVSAEIRGGEKIGIIGRTGSGKSSLMVALFRLVELSSGHIEIDGVDIGKIGLESLRTRITLIPQDPVIFGGSVRYNLDPFATSTDEAIWKVLSLVNLAAKVRSMDGQLDFILSEGESLSVGERQLLCVARALLRQTSILILDEATASVDIESDNLIQQVIATQFQGATVLAIAHRLSTIMDFDRILVMDNGSVAEFGVPHELLQSSSSALLSLVEATGPASAAHLKSVAKQSYENVKAGRPAHVEQQRTGQEEEFDTAIDTSCVRFHTEEDAEKQAA